MSLLIDGYNLLNAAPVDPVDRGPTPLFRARQGLLNFLGDALDEKIRGQTTIVFDASEAPPGLPREFVIYDMKIIFAREFPQADVLIEELIEAESAPRSLLVVSGDHRLHRAARRRGAKAIDSDVWYESLRRRRRDRPHKQPEKPALPQSDEEAAYWVERFRTPPSTRRRKT
jgi:predicted RNA-binding protein with PIN domain